MPKKAEIPEHWKEDAEEPDWMHQDDDVVYESEPISEDMVYDEPAEYVPYPGVEEEDPFILGEQKTPTEYIQPEASETERLEQEYQELLGKKIEKRKIKEAKGKIRRLKYEPIFDIASSMRGGINAATGKISAVRGTPEERAIKKEKFKQTVRSFAERSQGAMDRLGGLGGSGASFGMGSTAGRVDVSGGQRMNLLGDGAQNTPRILQGETVGSNLLTGNLLGGTGSGFMNADIMGSISGRKAPMLIKKTGKKGKRKKGRKKSRRVKKIRRPPAGSNMPAIMKGGMF